MIPRILSLVSLILPLLFSSAIAEKAPPKTDFRLLLVSNEPLWDLFYDLHGKPVRLATSITQFSGTYEAPSSAFVSIYKLIQPHAPDDPALPAPKPIRQPIAEVSLTAGVLHSLVLLSPNPPGSPLPFSGYCIDDSRKEQPINTLKVLSLSKRKIALKFDTTFAEILPGTFKLFPYSVAKGWVELQLASQSGDHGWLPLMETVYNIVKGGRVFAIAMDDPATAGPQQLVQLRFIPDTAPPIDESPSL